MRSSAERYPNINLGDCTKCPVVLARLATINEVDEKIFDFGATVLSPFFDEHAPDLIKEFRDWGYISDEMAQNILSNMTPEEIATEARKCTSLLIERGENLIDLEAQLIEYISQNCPGPLEMSAVRQDTEISVTLCSSPRVSAADSSVEHTTVVRRPINPTQ